jgi:uncharacterized protein (UPF0332 family)
MSFDWQTYIRLAEELLNNSEDSDIEEAYLRSSLSRSYYGVFGIAYYFLIHNQKVDKEELENDTHRRVRNKFIHNPQRNRLLNKIGKNLESLWKERKDADYKEDSEINRNRAETAYLLASDTIGIFRSVGGIQRGS